MLQFPIQYGIFFLKGQSISLTLLLGLLIALLRPATYFYVQNQQMLFRILLLLCFPHFLLAWGANGHRAIAKICVDNLSPAARERVDAAIGDNLLEQLSTWPDFIRSEKGWDFTHPWHYMTVHPDQTITQVKEQMAERSGIDDVREGIELMTEVLRGDETARNTLAELMEDNRVDPLAGSLDATALAFLIHFIGDVHMPLHVGKNKDLGGNRITVHFFGDRYNLHSVWDTQMIEHERLSYTELAAFSTIHTRAYKEEWSADPLEEWIAESIELRERIYNTLYDRTDRESGLPDLSWNYQHDFYPIVEQRLAAAGYRAAAVLNDIFG